MSIKDKSAVLSLVVPVHNEEATVNIFYDTLQNIKKELPVAINFYFIDDGSDDKTLSIVKSLNKKDESVHYLSFSRNFGKEAALYAGLQHADGDYVAVMDVDLQDPPELLPEMLSEVMAGPYDAVGTRRVDRRKTKIVRTWFSTRFYKWMNRVSQMHLVEGARDYRVMKRQMVDAILSLPENQRFSKGIFTWVGFHTKYIPFEDRDRVAGKSSWTFWNLTKYGIEGIVSFSTLPLTIVTFLGLFSFGLAVVAGIFIVARALIDNTSVAGWPSMATIILFIGGIQLLSLGVIGRYLSAVFLEVKRRPVYITKEEK
ncbi:glycosyltransferase family 2 protein [Fructobacillus tropaeoli]|uniref:glycosyltransferase family 2 protein n=1 Tax=Fructobacillus tropaeoli TaxID=709323 RepID=UPI002D855E06|nr:Glycosyltransferase involved in cell wall bisynthesis (WcaA) [Fructobacillus tropaeoli]